MTIDGVDYPAEEIAQGAAFEAYSTRPAAGFLPNPRPGAHWPYRRFVHATEVGAPLHGLDDEPLLMPVTRSLDWTAVHRMSQSPGAAAKVAVIRRTAIVRRGTRMIKFLSGRQLAGYLRGWPISGFCYRVFDVAHLRTPDDLAALAAPSDGSPDVVFAVRWRAVDGFDYDVPLTSLYPGLVAMPPHDRLGPPVIGTGFAPSGRHIIPEFVTADLAELPIPANTSLVAYTADGTEVTLYTYLPEQRAWSRMHGPQWRHLLPDEGFPTDQEYFPVGPPLSRYVGKYRDNMFEAIVDPPGEFRVAAKTRAARYPLEALARRVPYATWRDARCTVIRQEGDWLRLRLSRPDGDQVARLGAHCVERGVYEAWAPTAEATDAHETDHWYEL